MRKALILPVLALLVAGCGDPLRDVPRLAEVPVAPQGGQAAALGGTAAVAPDADADQARPRGGLLGFLRGKAQEAEAQDNAAQDDAALPVDGSAGGGIAADVAAPEEPEVVLAVPTKPEADKPRGGLFGFLTKAKTPEMAEDKPETSAAAAPEAEGITAETQALAQSRPAADSTPKRGGLFGFLKAGKDPDSSKEDTRLAALPPETKTDASPKRGGLFGKPRSASTEPKPGAPDYEKVGPGVTLPYGKIARLCGVSASKLGRKVAKAPSRGRGFSLYDSAPGNTAPHNFYLTGFDDGCARQFTGAMVMFSKPSFYELIRFGAPGGNLPKSDTDAAYDRLKSKVCGVGRKKPCGDKVSKLDKNTVFVSIYDRSVDNTRWATLLLHDGAVLALDVKSTK